MDVMFIYLKAHQQQKVKKIDLFQIKKMITVLKIRKLPQRLSSVMTQLLMQIKWKRKNK